MPSRGLPWPLAREARGPVLICIKLNRLLQLPSLLIPRHNHNRETFHPQQSHPLCRATHCFVGPVVVIHDPTLKGKAIFIKTKQKNPFCNLLKNFPSPFTVQTYQVSCFFGLSISNITDISIRCHYLGKVSVWKSVKLLISNTLQRNCGELFAT